MVPQGEEEDLEDNHPGLKDEVYLKITLLVSLLIKAAMTIIEVHNSRSATRETTSVGVSFRYL